MSRWLKLPQNFHILSRYTGIVVLGAQSISVETCNRFHFARRIINGNSIRTSQFIHLLAFLVDLPWGGGQKGRIFFQLKCHKAQTGCLVTPSWWTIAWHSICIPMMAWEFNLKNNVGFSFYFFFHVLYHHARDLWICGSN